MFKIIHCLETAVGFLVSAGSTTGDRIYHWLRALEEHQLWPIGKRIEDNSLSTVFDRMKTFREPWYALERESAQLYQVPWNIRPKLIEFRENLLKDKLGICLDCANTNGESAVRGECRLRGHGALAISIK